MCFWLQETGHKVSSYEKTCIETVREYKVVDLKVKFITELSWT